MEEAQEDYISLTNIARHKNPNEPKDIVKNWMRSKTTIEFLGLWEKLHNPKFKGVEFDSFAREAGSNSFVLSPTKWVETTLAIGIISKPGNNRIQTDAIKETLIPPIITKEQITTVYASEADLLNVALFGKTAR